MEGLSGAQLLEVWERGRGQDPAARGLTLWRAAEADAADRAPVGRRDAALLRLRAATFGRAAECFVGCPVCAEPLEFAVDVTALVVDEPDRGPGPWEVAAEGWQVRFRLPGSADLAEAGPAGWLALARRCVVDATRDGAPAAPGDLPADVAKVIEAEMGRLDPQAELVLRLACAACGHGWDARFDIAAFLWREVEVAARALLAEVDALARGYGWSERDILALSPARRRSYLELVAS